MKLAIGIDFGGTSIKSALVQGGSVVKRGTTIETQHHSGSESLLDAIVAVIAELRDGHEEVTAVGIGMPGIVDSKAGIVHGLTNVPGWEEVPLRAIITERTGLHTIIENDANAMAYGEFRYGAAKEGQNAICITLGTGVGGGLILDGRLYRGSQLGAGEIGHTSIDYAGLPGPYGNNGGLEEYVGNQQISERAIKRYQAAGQALPTPECTPADLAKAAEGGDAIAQSVWNDVGIELGAALTNAVWLLNPDTIVIGGGVAKAGDLVFAPVSREITNRTQRVFHDRLRVVPAALGNDAGMIGCAILALEAATGAK